MSIQRAIFYEWSLLFVADTTKSGQYWRPPGRETSTQTTIVKESKKKSASKF